MSEVDSRDIPKPMTEEQIRRVAVGLTSKQISGKVVLVIMIPRGRDYLHGRTSELSRP